MSVPQPPARPASGTGSASRAPESTPAARALDPQDRRGPWTHDGLTATGAGATVLFDAGDLVRATVRVTLTLSDAPVGVLVRYLGPTAHLLVEAVPERGALRILRATPTGRDQLVEAPVAGLRGTVTLRIDVDGPHVTIHDLQERRLISASVLEGESSAVLGVLQTGQGRTGLGPVTVEPLRGARVHWPVFSHRCPEPDVSPVPGTWEDSDVNNPNVVWDPEQRRWVMYYTGYSATKPSGDDGVQMAGIAYAETLDGPWRTEPANPVIEDPATGAWSQNGGMERLADGTWIIAANVNARTGEDPLMGTWFYTAPAPSGPWTRTAAEIAPYAGDPWLRRDQRTGDLQHWAWTLDGTRRVGTRWISSDGGASWSDPEPIVPSPPISGVNNGEQCIWVAPGREGVDLWLTTDFFPHTTLEAGRGMLMAHSPDDGASWLWHVAMTASGSRGWDARAAFDSALVHDPDRGRLYLFHAGSVLPDTGLLTFDIRIGHAWADWDPGETPYVPPTP